MPLVVSSAPMAGHSTAPLSATAASCYGGSRAYFGLRPLLSARGGNDFPRAKHLPYMFADRIGDLACW